jgi:hypothetical protein
LGFPHFLGATTAADSRAQLSKVCLTLWVIALGTVLSNTTTLQSFSATPPTVYHGDDLQEELEVSGRGLNCISEKLN